MAEDVESRILGRELGRLGGFGARFAARFLPNVGYDSTFRVSGTIEFISQRVRDVLRDVGKPIPEFPIDSAAREFSVIVGSGRLNLNPTILHVKLDSTEGFIRVSLRAVAKEGAVKQESARKLVERIEGLLALEGRD